MITIRRNKRPSVKEDGGEGNIHRRELARRAEGGIANEQQPSRLAAPLRGPNGLRAQRPEKRMRIEFKQQ